MNKDEYERIFKKQNLPTNQGIYTYILDNCNWKKQVLEVTKNKLGLEQFSNQHNDNGIADKKIPSIESWIKGFADADFIITDSFHGTVFSIIFDKPFISLVNFNRGASRFESLLRELGLTERSLGQFDKEKLIAILTSDFNTERSQKKLRILKEHSLNLLENSLFNL